MSLRLNFADMTPRGTFCSPQITGTLRIALRNVAAMGLHGTDVKFEATVRAIGFGITCLMSSRTWRTHFGGSLRIIKVHQVLFHSAAMEFARTTSANGGLPDPA
jgi:hypothetical protein